MPIIKENQIDEDYFKKYLLTAIMPNGDIVAIERGGFEGFHYEAFLLLINEISSIYKRYFGLEAKVGLEDNIEHFCEKCIIPISTCNDISAKYILEEDFEGIGFPNKCKKEQFESLKKMLPAFQKISNVAYYTYVNGRKTTEGLKNLQSFIESNLKRFEKEEFSWDEY